MIVDIDFPNLAKEMRVDFEETDVTLATTFDETETRFDIGFGELSEIPTEETNSYDGPYNVRPALVDQTLETEGLLMREDVTVEQIPIYIVSNNSGGNTVVIGG